MVIGEQVICEGSSCSSFDIGDPFVDDFFEDVEGDGAVEEDGVVKGADVETGAELFFGAFSELLDFEFANFVSECLAGPCDVAVDFVDDVEFRLGSVGFHVVDGFLP